MAADVRSKISRQHYVLRPPSEQLVDLHVYLAPQERWVERRKLAKNHIVDYSISSGFVRVLPQHTLFELRNEIDSQLGYEVLPRNYIFLRSVGRNFTQVKPKQEMDMKVKNFMPPYASEPEIYIKEGVYDSRWSQTEDSGLDDSLTDSNFSSSKSNRDIVTPDSNDELTSSPGPVQSPTTSGQGSSSTSSEDMAADVVTASSSHAPVSVQAIPPNERNATVANSNRKTVNGPSTRNRVAASRNRSDTGDIVPTKSKHQGLGSQTQSKGQIRKYPLTEARQRRRAAAGQGTNSGDSDTASGQNKGHISEISTTTRRRATNKSSLEGMTNKNSSSKTNGRKSEPASNRSRVAAKKQALSELNNGKLKEEDENEENKKDDVKEKEEEDTTETETTTAEGQTEGEKTDKTREDVEGEGGDEGDFVVQSTTIKLLDADGKEIETIPLKSVTVDTNDSEDVSSAPGGNDDEITRHHELSIKNGQEEGETVSVEVEPEGNSDVNASSSTSEEMKKGETGNESEDVSSRLNEGQTGDGNGKEEEEGKADSGSSTVALPDSEGQESGETNEQTEDEEETTPRLSIDVSVVEIDETNKSEEGGADVSQQKAKGEGEVSSDATGDGNEVEGEEAQEEKSNETAEREEERVSNGEEGDKNSVTVVETDSTNSKEGEGELGSTPAGDIVSENAERQAQDEDKNETAEDKPEEAQTNDEAETASGETTVEAEPSTKDETTIEAEPSTNGENAVEAEPSTNGETAVEAEPSTIDETAVEAEPSTNDETAVEAEPSTNDETAVEAEASTNDETAVEAEPSTNDETAVEAEPSTNDETAVEAEPSTNDETAVEAEPSTNEETAVEAEPSTNEETAVEAEPSTNDETTVEAEPLTNEEKVEAEPSTNEQKAVEVEPSTNEEAAVKAEPSTDDEPTVGAESSQEQENTDTTNEINSNEETAQTQNEEISATNETNSESEPINKDDEIRPGESDTPANEVASTPTNPETMDGDIKPPEEVAEASSKEDGGDITPIDQLTNVPDDGGPMNEDAGEDGETSINKEEGGDENQPETLSVSNEKVSKSTRKSKTSVAAATSKSKAGPSTNGSRRPLNRGSNKLPLPASKRKSSTDRLRVKTDETSGTSLRRSHSDSNGLSRLGLRAEGKGLGAYGNQFYSSYNLMKDIEDMDLENMKKYLSDTRNDRKELEVQREALVRRIRQLHNKANKIKEKAREAWRRRYLEAKKQTPKLEEECSRLRLELEKYLRELIAKVQGGNLDFPTFGVTKGEMPSNRFSYKIMILRMLQEIEDLRRRAEGAKIRHEAEYKLRDQAENDVKALREELVKKKIQVTLTRNQADSVIRDSYYANSF